MEPLHNIQEDTPHLMYHGEIPSDHYLNHMLDPFDRANVNYIHFSLHRYLLKRNVSSALIAVGSTVTGVASTEGFVGSAGPHDLDQNKSREILFHCCT